MWMEVEAVPEGLDDGNDPGHELCIRVSLQVLTCGRDCAQAKITEEAPLVLEEGAHDLRYGEDYLPVGNIQEEVFSHPDTPCLAPLGVA